MNGESRKPLSKSEIVSRSRMQFFWLYGMVALVVAAATIIVDVNNNRSTPIFLFLLIILIGLSLELGRIRAFFAWLPIVVLWIATKQMIGAWTWGNLADNALEVILLLMIAVVSGTFRDRQNKLWDVYAEKRLRMQILEDEKVGLLRAPAGKVRLAEEEERAVKYQRPVSFLLMQVLPITGQEWQPDERDCILQAVAAVLKDAAGEIDVPFAIDGERMGLILPETDVSGIKMILGQLVKNLEEIRCVQRSGEPRPLREQARVRFGYAVFLGKDETKPDLMLAAEKSLNKSIEENANNIFQNLFIEFEIIGRKPVQQSPVLVR